MHCVQSLIRAPFTFSKIQPFLFLNNEASPQMSSRLWRLSVVVSCIYTRITNMATTWPPLRRSDFMATLFRLVQVCVCRCCYVL